MSWFKVGQDAKMALEKAEKVSQLLKARAVPRFWLKVDEEADVIFVDDVGFWCERHVIKIGNRFHDVTCCAELRPCPICLKEGRQPIGIVFFTVIDLRQFVDKSGQIIKYRKVLLGAKRTLAKQIFDYKAQLGSLVGRRFKLKRYTSKDSNTGIIVQVYPKTYKLTGDLAIPFDYETILAPPTDEELQYLGYTTTVLSDSPLDSELDEELEEEFDEKLDEGMDEGLREELEEEELEDELEEGGMEDNVVGGESEEEEGFEEEGEQEEGFDEDLEETEDEDLDLLKKTIEEKLLKKREGKDGGQAKKK
ncbi:MAG: hypothetical protein QXT86_08840 [Archaeoglobaceae archaeon]